MTKRVVARRAIKPPRARKSEIRPNRLRELREGVGWSQEKLAEESGMSLGNISQLENHRINYSASGLAKLARALKCDPRDLVGRSGAGALRAAWGSASDNEREELVQIARDWWFERRQ